MTAGEEDQRLRTKVERIISAYELSDLGETLEQYWTRDEDRYSLRSLSDYVNEELLRAAMEDAGMRPLEGEAENTFRLLTNSEVSSGSRHQAERVLQREGIDVDQLKRDFVSHQAVHTYLRDCRGLSHTREASAEDRLEKAKETIDRLQSRTEAVTANVLSGVSDADGFPIDDFDVIVNLRIIDSETGEAFSIDELLEDRSPDS